MLSNHEAMAGVFLHRRDTHYDDKPDERYQFPKKYLKAAAKIEGDWVIFREPVKAGDKGFYAVAFVDKIVPDPTLADHYLALIQPGSYLDFPHSVPHRIDGALVESGLSNAQNAVRTLSSQDFVRIINLGLGEEEPILPRVDDLTGSSFAEERTPFLFNDEQERRKFLTSRTARDAAFRTAVVHAYDRRCAFSGLQFINGGGRAEVEAAHIKPVSAKGPDSVNNGLALSGTVHWMFDRGLLTLDDNLSILVSRHVNDLESVERLLRPESAALLPIDSTLHPRPDFLAWHREHIFKS
jgi:putative restriction endonuclease